jgi:hypothetical protein
MEQQQNIQNEPFPADSTLGAGKQKRIPQEQLQRERTTNGRKKCS